VYFVQLLYHEITLFTERMYSSQFIVKYRILVLVILIYSLGFIVLFLQQHQEIRQHAASVFISKSGNQFMVNGTQLKFTGYNYRWICGNPPTDAELEQVFSNIQTIAKGNVVRTALYQKDGNNGTFTDFDRYLASAKKHGLFLIPILVNEWKDCEPSVSSKTLSWYQSGYTQTNDGYPLSYKDYVKAVVKKYANEPTIAWWQLVNEPDGRNVDNSCNEAQATTALKNFADTMTLTIKTIDPNHMVDLGSISWCGGQGTDFQTVYSGNTDICDVFHDYSGATVVSPTQLQNQLAACKALSKPTYIGEAGICADVDGTGKCTGTVTSTTLQQRANFFDKKIAAAFEAGVSGYLLWNKAIESKNFDVGITDPTDETLAKYAQTSVPSHMLITPTFACLGPCTPTTVPMITQQPTPVIPVATTIETTTTSEPTITSEPSQPLNAPSTTQSRNGSNGNLIQLLIAFIQLIINFFLGLFGHSSVA
jgi:hypothetical protein